MLARTMPPYQPNKLKTLSHHYPRSPSTNVYFLQETQMGCYHAMPTNYNGRCCDNRMCARDRWIGALELRDSTSANVLLEITHADEGYAQWVILRHERAHNQHGQWVLMLKNIQMW